MFLGLNHLIRILHGENGQDFPVDKRASIGRKDYAVEIFDKSYKRIVKCDCTIMYGQGQQGWSLGACWAAHVTQDQSWF